MKVSKEQDQTLLNHSQLSIMLQFHTVILFLQVNGCKTFKLVLFEFLIGYSEAESIEDIFAPSISLTLLHSEQPKLYFGCSECIRVKTLICCIVSV